MIKINVAVDNKYWQNKIHNPKKYLSKKIKKTSNIFEFLKKKNYIFTILLTNSLNIKKLNKKFRKINKPTDVLSFPSFSKKSYFKTNKQKNIYLGDIAICYEIIKKRSKKKDFIAEFDKVWVHGFLHLLGYDHVKKSDYLKMIKVENKILSII